MASEADVTQIHEEIDKTRSDLTEKLETLEEQVRGTVLGATEKVEETIEQVTSTVQETVEQVKSTVGETVEQARSAVNTTVENVRQTFDLEYQMQVRPWTMLCGSLCVGLLAGALVGRQSRRRHVGGNRAPAFRGMGRFRPLDTPAVEQYVSGTPPAAEPPRESQGPGILSQLYHQFEPEIMQVKEMAIGYAAGMLRDMIKEAVPVLKDKIEDVMNRATTKVGGEPVHGPVLQSCGEGHPQERGSFGGPIH
jgi:ElaB/YqjD/DUF883 family membrane-anchored ribosome-binding protein